ncbi:MAG TPA: tetratricopeptide repeat protein, partial [Caulobacteraceae bacterium]
MLVLLAACAGGAGGQPVAGAVENDSAAIAKLDRAIRLRPGDAALYVNRGALYARAGDLDAAIADDTTAIGLNKADALAWRNRAA